MNGGELPECATWLVDERHAFLCLTTRVNEDWTEDVLAAISTGSDGPGRVGIDPVGMFGDITADDLRSSVLPVSRRGAEDLLRLLAVGSFFDGPDMSLREPDETRDTCVRDILASVGEEAEFFTNHGHAEDGDAADFLAAGFHYNSLARVLYDVCLIGVARDRLLLAWRFEDA
ncbi:hypothetical protein ACFT5C_29870 [Streptomyces sp. NPDC057116]|uniref:hypothetical protein n=1 Tax=Streptomyces sp. NPDC057116 TaxID=3346023 RepID=UPI0036286CD4